MCWKLNRVFDNPISDGFPSSDGGSKGSNLARQLQEPGCSIEGWDRSTP